MPRRAVLLLTAACTTLALATLPAQTAPPKARVHEGLREIPTYPFSEPNPIPILAKDTRLYPYFSFEGYAHDPVPQRWNVVTLENDLIEEIGRAHV